MTKGRAGVNWRMSESRRTVGPKVDKVDITSRRERVLDQIRSKEEEEEAVESQREHAPRTAVTRKGYISYPQTPLFYLLPRPSNLRRLSCVNCYFLICCSRSSMGPASRQARRRSGVEQCASS